MAHSNTTIATIKEIMDLADSLDLFSTIGGNVEHAFWLAIDTARLERVRDELDAITTDVSIEINNQRKRA